MAEQGKLDGWQEIADYLGKSVRSVQRWERKYGLPIHRAGNTPQKAPVCAFKDELATWSRRSPEGHSILDLHEPPGNSRIQRYGGALIVAGLASLALAVWVLAPREDASVGNPKVWDAFGEVTEKPGGAPLADVPIDVALYEGLGSAPSAVATGSDGKWIQAGFREGSVYRFTPSKDGYRFEPSYSIWDARERRALPFRAVAVPPFSTTSVAFVSRGNAYIIGFPPNAQTLNDFQSFAENLFATLEAERAIENVILAIPKETQESLGTWMQAVSTSMSGVSLVTRIELGVLYENQVHRRGFSASPGARIVPMVLVAPGPDFRYRIDFALDVLGQRERIQSTSIVHLHSEPDIRILMEDGTLSLTRPFVAFLDSEHPILVPELGTTLRLRTATSTIAIRADSLTGGG